MTCLQKYHKKEDAMDALVISLVFCSVKSKEITKLIPFKEQELNKKQSFDNIVNDYNIKIYSMMTT